MDLLSVRIPGCRCGGDDGDLTGAEAVRCVGDVLQRARHPGRQRPAEDGEEDRQRAAPEVDLPLQGMGGGEGFFFAWRVTTIQPRPG